MVTVLPKSAPRTTARDWGRERGAISVNETTIATTAPELWIREVLKTPAPKARNLPPPGPAQGRESFAPHARPTPRPGTVRFGENDPGDPGDLLEGLRLGDGVPAVGCVENEEHFLGSARDLPPDDAHDLAHLLHQVRLGVKAPGRVDQNDVRPPCLGGPERVEDDGGGSGSLLVMDDVGSRSLGPHPPPPDGGRPAR